MYRIYFYIAKKFWGPFLFALGVFAVLVVLGDTFENMKNLGNGTTTILDILSYSLLTFPNWLTTIMPVACLLGAISVISEMVSNGEWTACVAGGFAPRDLFKPIIACILSVVAITLLLQEFLVPPLNLKADEVYYTRIKARADFNQHMEQNVIIKISPYQMLFAKEVDLKEGTMKNVSLDTYNDGWDIANQIVAEQMVWDPQSSSWLFTNGIKRTFANEMDTEEETFEQAPSPMQTKPEDMSVNKTSADLLSIRDLTKRINFQKKSGLAHYSAETMRQSRLASPFVTVIMCLLGMPFAISSRRKSKILNILASIVIAFSFWWMMSMFTSFGENGYLNPFVAGWGPAVFFSLILFAEFKWLRL
jgi:lipopolysaccharide export system permease protein